MRPQRRNPLAFALILTFLLLSGATFAANDLQGRDMVRIGGDVTVDEGQVVKDAVAIGGSVTVHSGGRIMRDAVAIGGDVHLKANARVERDAVAIVGEVLKEEGASVGRDEVAILSGAKGIVPAFWKWSLLDILYGSYLASLMLHILMVLVIAALGILLLLFVPGPV
jgi:UDP-3-O-[3-hydroxymyristoyl] glucosamine N-acyltransferase